jgi:hypothetical protein
MRFRHKLLPVLLAVAVLGVVIAMSGHYHYPIRNGCSADFWKSTCGVDIDPNASDKYPGPSGLHPPPKESYLVYCVEHNHRTSLCRVSSSAAAADLPKVVHLLENAPQGMLRKEVELAFQSWCSLAPTKKDAAHLLDEIQSSWTEDLRRVDSESYGELLSSFDTEWERASRFWATELFEFAYLSGLILVVAVPWMRGAGRLGWAMHLGLLPILLMLPYYLGYASATFNSYRYSSVDRTVVGVVWPLALERDLDFVTREGGGMVYPHLVFVCRVLPWTSLDSSLTGCVPPVLQPLSQMPEPACVCYRRAGPVAMSLLSVAIGLFVFGVGTLVRWGRRKRDAEKVVGS